MPSKGAGAKVKPGADRARQRAARSDRRSARRRWRSSGKVVTRTYLGEKMEYEVEVAGQRVQIVRFNPPPSESFAPGEAVSVRLPHEGVQLLAKEAA